mgnify:CR=1 FL=1
MILVKIQDSHTGKGKRWRTIGTRQSESGSFTPIAIDEIPAKGGVRRYVRFLAFGRMRNYKMMVRTPESPKPIKRGKKGIK